MWTTPALAATLVCPNSCYSVITSANGIGSTFRDQDGGQDGPTAASSSIAGSLPVPPIIATSSAFGSADLAQGALRGRASSNGFGAGFSAQLGEVISFDLPVGLNSVNIPVTWTLEGSTNAEGRVGVFAFFRLINVRTGEGAIFDELHVVRDNPLHTNGSKSFTYNGSVNTNETDFFRVDSFLSGAVDRGSLDYGNTAFFNLALPTGVSLISSSGVLLSTPIMSNAVPEPATWAMMIAGFGLVGGTIRRRAKLRLQAG